MINLDLQETSLLLEILQEDRHELMTEINRTDSFEYKDMLKEHRRLLDSIIAKLPGQPAMESLSQPRQ